MGIKQYVGVGTTSAVAKVTSIELGRRWRLIYSGRAGEGRHLGCWRLGPVLEGTRGNRVGSSPSGLVDVGESGQGG